MSYEGYTERLCEAGHYGVWDAYQDEPGQCDCGSLWAWWHGVDVTNGYDESHPSTCDAPKREIGWDNIPHTDHLGNQYFTKRNKFAPVSAWVPCHTPNSKDNEA